MKKNKSSIRCLPTNDINLLLDRLGLTGAWYSLLASHLVKIGRKELVYILKDEKLKNAEIQDQDFLDGLSIGEISALYEYSLAYVDRDKRKQEGQYFTPDDVAQMMAKKAATFQKNKIWIDPCCGVGNLSYWLIHAQDDQESFLKHHLYLVDRDPLALDIARFVLTVNFQKKERRLFEKIKSRFIVMDFLSSSTLPVYDYAILNPPYVVVSPDKRFETSDARDYYAYFLEQVIKTSRGFVSITPQTFTNGQKFISLRKLLVRHFPKIDIYCFDNVPDNIFRGIKFGSTNTNQVNSTRAGIIVASKDMEHKLFRITPLLRWRVKDRRKMLDSVDRFLVAIMPRIDLFPKVQKDLLPLYDLMKKQGNDLACFISSRPTPYKLIVPSTPRYFVSALKRSVERSSFKILYFYNSAERDIAYLYLNSSYMYWWWRVNDGGMTISEKTLLTLPIKKETVVDSRLVSKIEKSEMTNCVIKRNAGKNNENVKHDQSLVKEINETLFPLFADTLALTHSNSSFHSL